MPLGSWDLLCRLLPWRPASPEGIKEQCWALCLRGQRSEAHLCGQQPFLPDRTWLEWSTAGIFSSAGDGHAALSATSPPLTHPGVTPFWFLSHILIRRAWGRPKWHQDANSSGNPSSPWAGEPPILRVHERIMTWIQMGYLRTREP